MEQGFFYGATNWPMKMLIAPMHDDIRWANFTMKPFLKMQIADFLIDKFPTQQRKKIPYEDNTKVAEVWEKFVRVSLGGKFYAFDTIMDKSYWEQWWCLFSEMDEQRSPTQILLFHNIILHNVKTSKNLFYSNMYTIFSSILYPLYTSHPDSL